MLNDICLPLNDPK